MPFNPQPDNTTASILGNAAARTQQFNLDQLGKLLEEEKTLNANAKAADVVFKNNPDIQQLTGKHPDEWKNLSARDKVNFLGGAVRSAGMQREQKFDEAKMAELLSQTRARDAETNRGISMDEATKLLNQDYLGATDGGTSEFFGRPTGGKRDESDSLVNFANGLLGYDGGVAKSSRVDPHTLVSQASAMLDGGRGDSPSATDVMRMAAKRNLLGNPETSRMVDNLIRMRPKTPIGLPLGKQFTLPDGSVVSGLGDNVTPNLRAPKEEKEEAFWMPLGEEFVSKNNDKWIGNGKGRAPTFISAADQQSKNQPNKDQTDAEAFADALDSNNAIIEEIEKSKKYDPTGTGSFLPGFMQKEDAQRYNAAKRTWIAKLLRRESGAAISNGEMDSYDKQYFPQFGDEPKVMKQKAEQRRLAGVGMRRGTKNANQAQEESNGPKRVETLRDFDALPKGALFIDPSTGKKRRKL